jgi:hypothetical protein
MENSTTAADTVQKLLEIGPAADWAALVAVLTSPDVAHGVTGMLRVLVCAAGGDQATLLGRWVDFMIAYRVDCGRFNTPQGIISKVKALDLSDPPASHIFSVAGAMWHMIRFSRLMLTVSYWATSTETRSTAAALKVAIDKSVEAVREVVGPGPPPGDCDGIPLFADKDSEDGSLHVFWFLNGASFTVEHAHASFQGLPGLPHELEFERAPASSASMRPGSYPSLAGISLKRCQRAAPDRTFAPVHPSPLHTFKRVKANDGRTCTYGEQWAESASTDEDE